MRQEISNLQQDKEQNENTGTVINIKRKIITPNKELIGVKTTKKRSYKRKSKTT